MNKTMFDKYFKTEIIPTLKLIENNRVDKPRRRQTYNDIVDYNHREGRITDRQRQNWIIPDRFLK